MAKAETLSKEEVEHLARLARLELTAGEVKLYAEQLSDVLGYVGKLQKLTAATKSVVQEPVTLRPDEVKPWPDPQHLIEQAPKVHDNLVEVPGVFDRE